MIGFLIAMLSGALMSVQGVFNTQVSKTAGTWTTNAFVQFTALVVCLAAWGMTERSSFGALLKVEPKYLLLGGVLGAMITLTVIKSMAALGPAFAAMLIVTTQVAAAYLIELFGMFGVQKAEFEPRKLIGLLIVIGGMILFEWKSKA